MMLNHQFGNRKNSFDLDAAAVLDEAWDLACTGRSIRAFSLANSVLVSAEHRGDQGLIAAVLINVPGIAFNLARQKRG
ncbi:hypothetical protein V6582_01660 (plasmid) [Agrobacterium vitis]|uniref:hypothetical protein n=1 Tax=Agrobacterium vitis TaxID=373 RepID=UPI0018D23177|nr:hypothetical protein [Agrobacterium vitis]